MPITKRELGFGVAVFGYALVAIVAFIYVARPSPGREPSLDGTERFAEEIGHGFISFLLIVAASLIAITFGSVGACFGSSAAKALLAFGFVLELAIAACLAMFLWQR